MGSAHAASGSEVLFEMYWSKAYPGAGVTPVTAAPLPLAHVAAPLKSPLGACSDAKPLWVMQKVEGSASYNSQIVETGTFPITQKDIKPDSVRL